MFVLPASTRRGGTLRILLCMCVAMCIATHSTRVFGSDVVDELNAQYADETNSPDDDASMFGHSSFLELELDLDLALTHDSSDSGHLDRLLALQDKYVAGQGGSGAPAQFEAEADADSASEHVMAAPLDDAEPHLLLETHLHHDQSQSSSVALGVGVGLSVGASAELSAAIAAGVDMSSESQMEAQLESLSAAQQSTDAAASASRAEAQTKNLLSYFWGNTPHKTWQDDNAGGVASQSSQAAPPSGQFVHEHQFAYLHREGSLPQDAKLEMQPVPVGPSKKGGKSSFIPPAQRAQKDTAAWKEFATHTANGRPRFIHSSSGSIDPTRPPTIILAQQPKVQRIAPSAIGQKETFWLSTGVKQFAFNGAKGHSYPFGTIDGARSACAMVGADLASRAQLSAAYQSGAEWCACGAVAEGAWGFPMQRRVNGCGTGPGTNEVCKAGGATCFGFKPTRAAVALIGTIAPFKPGQWNADKFASLNAACLHGPPFDPVECLQRAWSIAGCSPRGSRYPSSQASMSRWNQITQWTSVVKDIEAIERNDQPGGTTEKQCKGPREVFFFAAGPKRFIWNGQSGEGYPYNTRDQAQAGCESIGATLATKAQLQDAWRDGAEWCMCGALADDKRWAFPMHHALPGCGSKEGVVRTCSAGGATCYGVKPTESHATGISPFKPGQWHADRWTPLVKLCSHEPPFSLDECVRPAWKLAGCTSLGADYPVVGGALVNQYNTMSWDSVREDMLNRARTDPPSCQSKFAALDAQCAHPPPYSTKRCLRAALSLAGCDRTGFLWPIARSTAPSFIWWNNQPWPTVVRDIQRLARADLALHQAEQEGGCRGMQEAFWYSGDKEVAYRFDDAEGARTACARIGSTLATPEQVSASFVAGAEWCAAGFTTDGRARYPMQAARTGCASAPGVAVWANATKGGATCFGFKPNPAEVDGLLPFNPHTRFSQMREWKVTPTTNCSRVCGGGKQTRTVHCMNASSSKRRPDHTCLSLGPKPPSIATCNPTPCEYDWLKAPWSDCSASCASGTRTRSIRCIQARTGNEFPDAKCLRLEEAKTETSRPCNTHPCLAYHWKLAPWTKCNTDCGGGMQSRNVHCLGSDQKIHEAARCITTVAGPQPKEVQKCNTASCPTYAWRKDEWNTCSLSCGGGQSSRLVACVGSDGSVALDEGKCANVASVGPRPRTVKPCNTVSCLTYTWTPSVWSNCSHTCGGGSSTRVVKCVDSKNTTADNAACAAQGPQPSSVKNCATIPCQSFNWRPAKWSSCTSSCGGGNQQRKVQCVGDDGSLAKDAQCANAGPKKDVKQACATQPCITLQWTLKATKKKLAVPVNTTGFDGWSVCSEQCGGGIQTRSYECKASDGSSRDLIACATVLGTTPTLKQACQTQECVTYDFKPAAWSDCNLSCGGGLATRDASCIGSDDVKVPSVKCTSTGIIQPKTQKACNTQMCEAFTWTVSAYSTCDAGCGGGMQTREVTCQGSSGKTYADRHCAQLGVDKPDSARPCATHRCVSKKWRLGTWDSCDVSCGGGETHRTVACFGTDGKSYSANDCLASYKQRNATLTKEQNTKPEGKKACHTQACLTYFWDVKQWIKCGAKCGGSLQTRPVACMSSDGKEQPDALCASLAAKPTGQQACNTLPCPSYKLVLSAWDSCSASCGNGVQNRTVTCRSSRGVLITDAVKMAELCPTIPELAQPCNPTACLSPDEQGWVVKPWSTCDLNCGGGVQQRLVQCVSQVDKTCGTFGIAPVAERACSLEPCTSFEYEESDWSECSYSCGPGGVQRRSVTCTGSDGSLHNPRAKCADAGVRPSSTKPCMQNPCVQIYWKASDWSTCSKPCGDGGTSTRDVYCQGSDGAKRTDDACANQGAKPENTKACNTAACEKHEFKVGKWESCTVGCGSGLQTRSVECRSSTTQKLVDVKKCTTSDTTVPTAERECNATPCVAYFWQLGSFGDCSNTCNGGFQLRTVTCMGTDGARYKDDFCLAYAYKAPTQAICNTKPCGTFSWQAEPVWSSCSVSCDGGIQVRPVKCVGPDGNVWPKATCANSTLALGVKPTEPTQTCATHACMTTMWDVTPFSNCTAHCGGGKQVRSVSCRKSDGTRIPDRVCSRIVPKPTETQECNSAACSTFSWKTDGYDECSRSCGSGIRTREIRCENNFGSRMSSRHCYKRGIDRPVPSEACNTAPCLTASSWTIDPWQLCSSECGGTGMRIRNVNCRVGNNATDKHCQSILPMPSTTEQCNTHACLAYKYVSSPWTVCSKSCDDHVGPNSTDSTATQSRQLRCIASDGSYSSLKRCALFLDTVKTPATSRVCRKNASCKRYRWVFGKWDACTKSCGSRGEQNRSVYCADEKGTKKKKSLCVFSGPKPYASRRCNSHKCVRQYEWRQAAWTECGQSCSTGGGSSSKNTGGTQARKITCHDRFGANVTHQACELTVGPAPVSSQVCNRKPCVSFKWASKPWTACSTWCSGGTQEREITCAGSDGRVHKEMYCTMTSGEKAETERVCNTVPCVSGTWKKAAAWSACTKSCGSGTRTRSVACVGSDGSVLPDNACSSDGTRPKSSSACNKQKCLSTSWFVGTWSACSINCDEGTQTREVACIASDGVVKADISCAYAGEKAKKEQVCNTTPCDQLVRQYTEWSECDSSCGGGKQTRTQTCLNTLTSQMTPQTDCAHAPIAELVRPCGTTPCLTFQWNLGSWATCSKECGGGEKSRDVTCVGSNGVTVADSVCVRITAKPDVTRACRSTPCNDANTYGWKVEEWTECDAECNTGKQTRGVLCTRKTSGAGVDDASCVAKRPPTQTTCNTKACSADQAMWKAQPWEECSKPCGSGQATRDVSCVDPHDKLLSISSCASVGTKPTESKSCNTFLCAEDKEETERVVKTKKKVQAKAKAKAKAEADADADAQAESDSKSDSDLNSVSKSKSYSDSDSGSKSDSTSTSTSSSSDSTNNSRSHSSKKKKLADKPPAPTLYGHRQRRSLADAIGSIKSTARPSMVSSSAPSIITGPAPSGPPPHPVAHGVMSQSAQKDMLAVTYGVHDEEVKAAMQAQAKSAMVANDLPAEFDQFDANGVERTDDAIDARKTLRAALMKEHARPGMSDEEDMHSQYDQFNRDGRARTDDEIEQRDQTRSHMRPIQAPLDELKEVYDLYLPSGQPRSGSQIALRRSLRLRLSKNADKADQLSEMYDATDPSTGEARPAAAIKHRKLARAKRVAWKVARQLTQAKLDAIEAERVATRNEAERVASLPHLTRDSAVTRGTGGLSAYNSDGSCSDSRGCVLAGADDSAITPELALRMLPLTPQFNDKVVDEYEP